MFKVKIGEDEYEVKFTHFIPTDDDRVSMEEVKFREMFGTICYISKLNSDELHYGASDLSIHDNFNRNIGRKISLAKALSFQYPVDTEKRKMFWNAYFKARGGKW